MGGVGVLWRSGRLEKNEGSPTETKGMHASGNEDQKKQKV